MVLLRFKDTPRRKKVTTRSYPECQAAAFGVSNHFPSAELKVMSKVPRVPKQTPKILQRLYDKNLLNAYRFQIIKYSLPKFLSTVVVVKREGRVR